MEWAVTVNLSVIPFLQAGRSTPLPQALFGLQMKTATNNACSANRPIVSPINPLARVPVCSNTATGYIALSAGKKKPLQANLYQLDCITGNFQPLIDTTVSDFAVTDNHLYYIAHGRLYHYDLDTQQCSEVAACQALHCPEAVDTFLNHASCNHSVSLIALENHVFYVNPKQQLCLLTQSQPPVQRYLCFLQQQDQFIIAVLQNKQGQYRTVVLDRDGNEILALSMLAKVTVDQHYMIYTDGTHFISAMP